MIQKEKAIQAILVTIVLVMSVSFILVLNSKNNNIKELESQIEKLSIAAYLNTSN